MTQILIVDDEPFLREELQESLELEDYDVVAAASVPEALAELAKDSFDVVVTDLKMPKVSGLDLLRKLSDQGFAGRVVVVSGHGAESSREEAMALGAVACFAKPLDVEDLIDLIEGRSDAA